MKMKTTAKFIKGIPADHIAIGYCGAQTLLSGSDPFAYTTGIYGWNFDAYQFHVPSKGMVIISTGYRNMPGRRPNNLKEYEARASAIAHNWNIDYKERNAQIAELLNEFLAQA